MSICSQNKKNIFKRHCIILIIPGGIRYVYLMYITYIPDQIKVKNEFKYILTIIDTFSKQNYAYLLYNKKAESVLINLKHFINNHGQSAKMHTNNGKEFNNKLINDYFNNLRI